MSSVTSWLPRPIQNLVAPKCRCPVGNCYKPIETTVRIATVMRIALAAAAVYAVPYLYSLSLPALLGVSVGIGLGSVFLSRPIASLSVGSAAMILGVEVLKTAAAFGGFLTWAEGVLWVLGGLTMIQYYDIFRFNDRGLDLLEKRVIWPLAEGIARRIDNPSAIRSN